MKPYPLQIALTVLCVLFQLRPAWAQLTAFTYQGRLNLGGAAANGLYDLRFTVFDSTNSPGTIVAGPMTNAAAGVSNGLFTATIDFGTNVFTGAARWLEIGVRTNGGGSFNVVSPRQALSGSPYALFAYTTSANVNNTVGSSYAAVGGGLNNQSTGAYSTAAGGQGNISSGFVTAVGGGLNNEALVSYATVGGGVNNFATGIGALVGGGAGNTAYGQGSAVVGGYGNGTYANYASIGGGSNNTANAAGDVIGGGFNNTVNAADATIGGGFGNTISAAGTYGTIPGGFSNLVAGFYGFAAGQDAEVLHNGSFVWADSSASLPFASSGPNQFLVRAVGGVGIGVNNPGVPLDVGGRVRTRDGAGNAAAVVFNTAFFGTNADIGWVGAMDATRLGLYGNDPRGGSGWGLTFDTVTGNVGIGTGSAYPSYKLQVNGSVGGVGAYNNISDARFKTNVVPINGALELVGKLCGVRFDWRAGQFPAMNFESGRQLGFIAQEVQPVLPEAVSVDAEGVHSIAYTKIIPVLVEAIKEQQGQMRERDARIGQLEHDLAELRAAQKQTAGVWEARFTALEETVLERSRTTAITRVSE